MQFWTPDDEHICSKHVEAWNKRIVKQNFCASSWLITEINILKYTVSKTSKNVGASQSDYNVNFKTLPSLIKRTFIGVRTLFVYDMFLTKHCVPFIRLLMSQTRKTNMHHPKRFTFVWIQKYGFIHPQECGSRRAWERLRYKHDDGCNAGKWRSRVHRVPQGDRSTIMCKWLM